MCLSSYHVNIEATPTTYYYFLSDQAILEIKKNNTSPIFFKANIYSVKMIEVHVCHVYGKS